MIAATTPRRGVRKAKLLVIDEHGRLSSRHAADLPSLLRAGDLVVANDAATMPASLTGTHVRTGRPVELRLAGRRSLAGRDADRFIAVTFGAGDYRTPTERRPDPPRFSKGDDLLLGPLHATVLEIVGHQRLVELGFNHPAAVVWEGIARHGRPIQYAYMPDPLATWDTWTSIASLPVAFEPPSAGFVLDWATLRRIRSRGAQFATVTHAAGISSTGDAKLDALLPFDEPYSIPPPTATLIRGTQLRGNRVVAIGTTTVRALEDAARVHGVVAPGNGLATHRIGEESDLRVVDAIVTGLHEHGSSHYELLRAFQTDSALEQMLGEAKGGDYRAHEFGDTVFISRSCILNSREIGATA
jgi:S-adenosylmethionine:tRNA ribosyltransferase-isomerase